MILLADENIDRPIVERLRQEGYNVLYVAEMAPGISDVDVLDMARKENAILLTSDTDFGELVFRQKRISSGVVLFRLAGLLPLKKAKIVFSAINSHADEIPLSFTVVTPGAIRIRSDK